MFGRTDADPNKNCTSNKKHRTEKKNIRCKERRSRLNTKLILVFCSLIPDIMGTKERLAYFNQRNADLHK